jgi:hypothetical protein
MANPVDTSKIIYLTQAQNVHGGRSSYHYNWEGKSAGLDANLPLVLPYGSTWAIQRGELPEAYAAELTNSLIPSASFEKDLGSWTGVRSTLSRKYSLGSLFADTLVHGTAYCRVLTSNTNPSGDISFGISTGFIPVKSGHGYYTAVAIKPEMKTLMEPIL